MIDTVVMTDRGRVRGRDQDGVASFRGLPFAAPPQGRLRFQPPEPPPGWDGVRDCLVFGSAPPQLSPRPGVPSPWRAESGLDCLSLNVWSPDVGHVRLPVMVWFYGGLWKYGSSSMPHYDAATLARSGVIVVTVNYRVGFEGFGRLPGVPDNRGLRDQLAALEWVQRNIAAFGGDPDSVTVFGQSAGAASAALLAGTAAAGGMFHRVIAQSIPSGQRTLEQAEAVTAQLAAAAGVRPTWEGFAALPPEAILAVQDTPLTRPEDGLTAFGPVVDGDLVSGPPWAAVGAGAGSRVDLICGFTHEESRGMAPAAPPGIDLDGVAAAFGLPAGSAAAYRAADHGRSEQEVFAVMLSDALVRIPTLRVAEAHAGAGGWTWLYDFAWRGPTVGAGHGIDVPFIFGDSRSRYAARFLGTPPSPDFGPLSDQLRQAWTGFARTGDPGWPRFDPERQSARRWDTTPRDVEDPLAVSRGIWRDREPS